MRLLVVGEDRVDAGKTTFSTGLCARLGAPGFKPRAGNDYWFDHGDVRAVLAEGRLHGKDARRLAAAGAGDADPEALNPVHRLWRPTPDRTGLLGERGRTFLCDRVTTPDGPRFVVNGEAEGDGLLPDRVREALPLSDAPRVASIPAFNDRMAESYLPAFSRVAERVGETDPAVVESYADIARPLDGVAFDAVAAVAPGRVRVYDGGRYRTACEAARGGTEEGRLEERVERVVGMLDPVETVELPALTGDERRDPERVADAYAGAYDAFLGAARAEGAAGRTIDRRPGGPPTASPRGVDLPRPGGPSGAFDVVVGSPRDARAVAGVHLAEFLGDDLKHAVDAPDQRLAVALLQIGPAEAPVLEDEIAREQHARRLGVETEVVVFVAGRVERDVLVVAKRHRPLVFESVIDRRVVGVVPPRLDVERRADGVEGADVVRVGVGEHDGVEVVRPLADRPDGVEVRPRIDEDGPLAGDEKRVAGERLHAGGDV